MNRQTPSDGKSSPGKLKVTCNLSNIETKINLMTTFSNFRDLQAETGTLCRIVQYIKIVNELPPPWHLLLLS